MVTWYDMRMTSATAWHLRVVLTLQYQYWAYIDKCGGMSVLVLENIIQLLTGFLDNPFVTTGSLQSNSFHRAKAFQRAAASPRMVPTWLADKFFSSR
jgi:hypothetical protein